MSLSEHISSVIKSARELKKIADEMGNIELKSRLLDEIDRLQELREALAESGELATFTSSRQEPSQPIPTPPPEPNSSDVAHVVQPGAAGETYDIHVAVDEGESDTDDSAQSEGTANASPDPQEAERFRMGEALLRQLEPQHQKILQRMNDILTEEQKIRKQTLTREGQAAGKAPNQIQQEVMASLELTDKQKQLLAEARKELHDIRAKIAREVDELVTVEQRKRLQKQIQKEIAAGK